MGDPCAPSGEAARDLTKGDYAVPADQCVSVIALGSIECDCICDYLETFGKIGDLVDIYAIGDKDVQLWCFEEAASADAASRTLIHYATNDRGGRVKLEIRSEPFEYSPQCRT